MTELKNELLAVQIRHKGQCPHPKGHIVDVVFGTILLTLLVTMFCILFVAIKFDTTRDLRKEAIDRGYAIHDPITGVWKWK